MTYIQHLGINLWRKKTAILIACGLLVIIICGLQYSRFKEDGKNKDQAKNLQFSELSSKDEDSIIKFGNYNKFPFFTTFNEDKEERENIIKKSGNDLKAISNYEKQLGIPQVNIDYKNLYVPHQRIVHFDFKGAPPKVSYLKQVFSMIKTLGATGVLIEYEDMFPFKGVLKQLSAKNCYSESDISEILKSAEDLKLDVIPLVQTFGHVEFALKYTSWMKLREVPNSPQALCPSKNDSLELIREIIQQVMTLHPNSKYLHIGCDEVYHMGECEVCRLELRENLFLRHIRNVAKIVSDKFPNVRLIIWDDMLRHISQQSMLEVSLGEIVDPMIWVYAEDIYRFVQLSIWEKYAAVFKTAWTASAFKGAFGETLYVPNAKRHLENNLQWLYVMAQQEKMFKNGLAGITLTGWQRYDHFAVLCELLPASIPSLALSLLTVTNGHFNMSLRGPFLSVLSCPEHIALSRPVPFINLYDDPFLWEKVGRCMFPGSPTFRLTYRLHNAVEEANEFIKSIEQTKGWLTLYNVKHNFSSPLRIEEVTSELPRIYHGFLSLMKSTQDILKDVYDNYTVLEWIEQRIYPYVIELEKIQNQTRSLARFKIWPARPLPPLNDLQRLGISIPKED